MTLLALWLGFAASALAAPYDRTKNVLELRGKRVVVVAVLGHTAMAFKDNGFFSKYTNERVDPGFTIEPLVRTEVVTQLRSFGVETEGVVVDYDDETTFENMRPKLISGFPGGIRKTYLATLTARLFAEHRPDAILVVSRANLILGGDSPYKLGYGVVANAKLGIPFAALYGDLFVPGKSSPLFYRVASMSMPFDAVESEHEQNLPTPKMWKALQPKIEECAQRSARVLAVGAYARARSGSPMTWDDRRRYPRDDRVMSTGGS